MRWHFLGVTQVLGDGDHNGLSQEIGGGVADVGAGHGHLAGLELHLAGGVADVGDLTVGSMKSPAYTGALNSMLL